MNMPRLTKRIDALSSKLVDEPRDYIGRFDNSTFSEAEKALFLRIEKLQEEFGPKLTPEILQANKDIINKGCEILFRYATGTLKFTLLSLIGDPNNRVDQLYFDLHYLEFFSNLKIALKKAHENPEIAYDRLADFFLNMTERRAAANKQPFTDSSVDKKTEYSEDTDNEHYDPYYRN